MTAPTLFAVPALDDRPTEPVGPVDEPALVVDVDGATLVEAWIVAGTPTSEPYPCRCDELSPYGKPQCDSKWCPCWGRLELDSTPYECCGRRWSAEAYRAAEIARGSW